MHSADEILPQFQDLKVGDAQRSEHGPVLRVAVLEPERSLVLRSDDGNWVWAFSLSPRRTRHQADQPEPDRTPGAPPPGRLFNRWSWNPAA